MCLRCFPRTVPYAVFIAPAFRGPTPPFPTRGLCRVGISPLSFHLRLSSGGLVGTMKELRLLAFHLVRSLFTRGAIPPLTLSIRSPPRQDRRGCAGTLFSRWRPSSGALRRRNQALPCSQGTLAPLPCSSDPGQASTPGHSGVSVLPPLLRTRRPQLFRFYRDSIARLRHSLSTLHAALADDDARLASVWRPPFHRRALSSPAGFR